MKNKKGFTLIELLLYITIAGAMILFVAAFLPLLMQSHAKNQAVAEVEQQGAQTMQIVTQTIRNSTAATNPSPNNTTASLTLTVPTPSNSPTVFDLSGGVLRITEGANPPVPLTNTQVTISSLSFENLSLSSTPGTIRVIFTITYNNSSGRNEFNFNKTFYGSGTIRQ